MVDKDIDWEKVPEDYFIGGSSAEQESVAYELYSRDQKIEQLTKELESANRRLDVAENLIKVERAEVERLRDALQLAHDHMQLYIPNYRSKTFNVRQIVDQALQLSDNEKGDFLENLYRGAVIGNDSIPVPVNLLKDLINVWKAGKGIIAYKVVDQIEALIQAHAGETK
jgi:hypothetical protein